MPACDKEQKKVKQTFIKLLPELLILVAILGFIAYEVVQMSDKIDRSDRNGMIRRTRDARWQHTETLTVNRIEMKLDEMLGRKDESK